MKELIIPVVLSLTLVFSVIGEESDDTFFGIPVAPNQKVPSTPDKGKSGPLKSKELFPTEVIQHIGERTEKGPLQYYWVDGNQGRGRVHLTFQEPWVAMRHVQECTLVLRVAKAKNSQSSGTIRVRLLQSDEVIGEKKGVPKGAELRIPLAISKIRNLDKLELKLTTRTSDGMRLLGEMPNAPRIEIKYSEAQF